ncbi:MAG: hypothetical protein AAF442_05465 [Pseudomonadota bacterium]
MSAWVHRYIETWRGGNCWRLFADIQSRIFRRDWQALDKATMVDTPQDGDALLVSLGKDLHIGTFVGEIVIHTYGQRAVLQSPSHIPGKRVGVYRCPPAR